MHGRADASPRVPHGEHLHIRGLRNVINVIAGLGKQDATSAGDGLPEGGGGMQRVPLDKALLITPEPELDVTLCPISR